MVEGEATTTKEKPAAKPEDHKPDAEKQKGDAPAITGDTRNATTTLQKDADLSRPENRRVAAPPKEGGKPPGVPDVTLVDDRAKVEKAEPAKLSEDAVKKTAKELHDAIHQTRLHFWDNPDKDKVFRILDPLNEADRKAVEKAYHDAYDPQGKNKDGSDKSTLKSEIKDKFGDNQDFRKAEAMLNRHDGRTNDAGNLMVALATFKDDHGKGEKMIRETFATLNSKDVAKLNEDFQQAYGKSYQQALSETKGISAETREAVKVFEKGVDNKQPQDVVNLANLAVKANNQELFADAVRGDSRAAQEGRKLLQSDADFKGRFERAFGNYDEYGNLYGVNQVAKDYLAEGHVSLSTITSENTGKFAGFIFNNKENVSLAALNASPKEREDFSRGRDLAVSGRQPASPAESEQLAFYNKIHKSFKDGGNEREVSMWEDQLSHGRETVISQMGKTQSNGWMDGGFFGVGSGHSRQDIMSKAENLSQEDWKLLRDKEKGPEFRRQIEESLKSYCDEGERKRIMQMLDDKTKVPGESSDENYKKSQEVRRSLFEVVGDNKGSKFLGMGTSYDGKNIVDSIGSLSQDEINKYRTDKDFHKKMDDAVKETLDGPERLLAQRLLQKASETGAKPVLDNVDRVLQDQVKGAKDNEKLRDIEKALHDDPKLRERLNRPDKELNEDERQIKHVMENSILSASMKMGGYPPEGAYSDAEYRRLHDSLFKDGHLPVDEKLALGFEKKDLYNEIAAAPENERKAAMRYLSDEQRKIVDNVMSKSDHKMGLADEMRSYINGDGGNYQDFADKLKGLSNVQKEQLKDEYARVYGGSLDDQFLKKVDDKDRVLYKNLMTPVSETDGRQDYYDNLKKRLDSYGFSPDGTALTMERASTLHAAALEAYQAEFKKLPPSEQEKMNEFFGEAFEQYKNSKEKLAEVLIDATITAAALAAAPFSGGVSLTAIAAIAAGGAAFRVAGQKLIVGSDFDGSPENVAKQLVIGGTTAALNFIGPEIFLGAGNVGGVAAGKAVAGLERGVIERVGQQSIERIGKELPGVITKEGVVDAAKLEKVVAQFAPASEREALTKTLTEQLTAHLNEERQALVAAGEQAGKQAAVKQFGKEVASNAAIGAGGNAAAELAVAPFNKNGVDWNNLSTGALTGLAVGAFMPVAIRGAMKAGSAGKTFIVNLTREADGVHINPAHITEPVVIRSESGELRTVKPGEGSSYRLKPGDEIVAAREGKINAEGKVTDAQGRPLNGRGEPAESGSGKPVEGKPAEVSRTQVSRDADGHLVNAEGKRVNEQGRLVNEKGQVLDSKGVPMEERFPKLSPEQVAGAREAFRGELAQIKASDGGSVLAKLENSGLSKEQQNRVLDSLMDVREHYVNTRIGGRIDADQEVNWIHTQGEFGRVIDAAKAARLSPAQTEDALLASMFSDSVKNKANFTTHHLDGELAAEQALRSRLGGEFTEERLNGIMHAIREHQIAPPEFMAMIYTGAIRRSVAAEGRALTQEETAALAKINEYMGDPFKAPLKDAPGGGKMIDWTADQRALLKRAGVDEWHVPSEGTPWNKISRALIDGDGIDNYATAGGLSKIIQIRGPESGPFFKDENFRFMEEPNAGEMRRVSSQQSWKDSLRDFEKVASPEGMQLARQSMQQADEAALRAQGRVDEWLRGRLGLKPGEPLPEIPGWTGSPGHPDRLKYPDYEQKWWDIHNKPAGARTPEEAKFYEDPANRYRGLNDKEIQQFKLAQEIRDRYAGELRKEQRVTGDAPPEYKPLVQPEPADAASLHKLYPEPMARSSQPFADYTGGDYQLNLNGRPVPINKQKISLGRLDNSDVAFANENVSRRHAEIDFGSGKPVIRDLGSTNGTFVNGKRINPGQEVMLKPGDKIRLGTESEFTFGVKPEFHLDAGGRTLDLGRGETKIGRSPDSDLVLADSEISRRHATISNTEKGPVLTDLGSTNGTYVNGTRLKPNEPVLLKPGDQVRFGSDTTYTIGKGLDAAEIPQVRPREVTAPRPVMEYHAKAGEVDVAANPEAVRQGNAYKTAGEIREPVRDGFQTLSGDAKIRADGTWADPNRPGVIVDRTRDAVLNKTIADAHARFDHLRGNPRALAEELAKYSKQLMHPNGWTEDMVDGAYNSFRNANRGKRILLGDYIERAARGEGAGVCQHQALLMKVLGDEFGLDVSLVSGFYGKAPVGGLPRDTFANHAWNEVHINGQTYIFDPRHQQFGKTAAELPKHNPSRSWLNRPDAPPVNRYAHFDANPGDYVSWDGDQKWTVTAERPGTPGNVVLRHSASRSNPAGEIASLNPGRQLVVGQKYALKRSSGEIEQGWQLVGAGRDGELLFYKADGMKVEVNPQDLARYNPK